MLTACYMGRLYFGIFWGEFRGWRLGRAAPGRRGGRGLAGPPPAESPLAMTVPLMILGVLALVAGALNPHQLAVVVPGLSFAPLEHLLAPVFAPAHAIGGVELIAHGGAPGGLAAVAIGVSVVAALGGLGAAYYVYAMRGGEPARRLAAAVPGAHRALSHKYWIDELYDEIVVGPVDTIADAAVWIDRWLVDGVIAGFTSGVVRVVGTVLRLLQTGRVQVYASAVVIGLAGVGWFFVRPHAAATTARDDSAGTYRVTAAPGLGYGYRWDTNGDGVWDDEAFGEIRDVHFSLERDARRTVRLQVQNAFGLRATREFAFSRPRVDRSRPAGGRNTVIQIDESGRARTVTLPDGRKIEVDGRPPPAPEATP